jgi:hypothetical protein
MWRVPVSPEWRRKALLGNSSKIVWPGYRKLITLVCLAAFVFVAFAHATHHRSKVDIQTITVATNFLAVDVNDVDGTTSDTFCFFCALAVAELPVAVTTTGPEIWEHVETYHRALASSLPPAEFPPPIS